MSEQNWKLVRGVKVNTEIAEKIFRDGLDIKINPKTGYPCVIRPAKFCARCASKSCSHAAVKWVQPLHVFVWVHFQGPVPKGKVVHHQWHDKMDARIQRLGIGTPSEHAKSHNRKLRRYSPRKRADFGGFRFHPPLPAQVITRPDLIGQTRAAAEKTARPRSLGQQLFDLEELLKRCYPMVLQGTQYLRGRERRIPRGASVAAWRRSETRRLGLRLPRLACDEAESCYVMLYASHRLSIEKVAADLGEPIELLRAFMKRVPVNEAIRRWVLFKRLPDRTLQRGWEEVSLQSSTKGRGRP